MSNVKPHRQDYVVAFCSKNHNRAILCRSCYLGSYDLIEGECAGKRCSLNVYFNNETDTLLCTINECFCKQKRIECGYTCERCTLNKRHHYFKKT